MRFRPGRRPDSNSSDLLRARIAVILASGFLFLLLFVQPSKGVMFDSSAGLDRAAESGRLERSTYGSYAAFALLFSAMLGAAWFSNKKENTSSRIWNNLEDGDATFPGSRALVVDHRLPGRQQLRQQLESLGLEVTEEGNGSRAADCALNNRFEVIFLALDLPIMNGVAVLELLRGSGIRIPIVMVCPAEYEDRATEKFEFVLLQPTQNESLCKVLQSAIPKRLQISASSSFREDLVALDEAFTSQDFERLAVIAQKLRSCGQAIGSDDLTDSVERLEACLHEEDMQDSQLTKIRDTIGELTSLAQDRACVDHEPERIRLPK